MFKRLLAASSKFRFFRPSLVRFSLCASKTYFCPLMNFRFVPVTRAYSALRTLSSASPRWRRMWNLSNRMAACGACVRVDLRNGFHMSITASRILAAFLAEKGIEPIHVGFGSAVAAEPNRPPLLKIAHHDAVSVTLPDRDLINPDHAWAGRSGALQLFAHVFLFEFLHRVPIEVHSLGDILIGIVRHNAIDNARRLVNFVFEAESRAALVSRRRPRTRHAEARIRDKRADHRWRDRAPARCDREAEMTCRTHYKRFFLTSRQRDHQGHWIAVMRFDPRASSKPRNAIAVEQRRFGERFFHTRNVTDSCPSNLKNSLCYRGLSIKTCEFTHIIPR